MRSRSTAEGTAAQIPAAETPAGERPAAKRPGGENSAPEQDELAHLAEVQEEAMHGGEAAQISAATRPLTAFLLRDEAKLLTLEGKNTQAVGLYRQALGLVDNPATHLELATLLLSSGHAADAVQETESVLAAEPKDVSALRIQGTADRALGDNQGAVTIFERALAIGPDANIEYALGSTYLALHDRAHADAMFRQLLSQTGDAAIWHVAIGDAYRQALYYDAAVEEFQKAIAIDPKVGHAEFFLGYTYLQLNQWGPTSESFKHLRAAVRLAPDEYVSNFYLGALESTDGSDLASSNRHLEAAAKADPSKPEVWLYLGLNAVRERDNKAAESYLRKAVALTGTDEAQNNYQIRRVYAVLGRLLVSEGNHAEGDPLLKRYKDLTQLALRNSSNTIARAAEDETMGSHVSALPAPGVVFPGSTPGTSVSAAGEESAKSAKALTPEQVATQKKLDTLLASSWNDLGTAEARMGQFGPALEHFLDAEQWGTPTPALLHNTAVAAFRVGNYEESARALEAYLKADQPDQQGSAMHTRAQMMLAMSKFSLGQFAQADQAFAAIPQATMSDPRAAYSWAFSMARSGKQQQTNKIADELTANDLPADEMSLVCHLYVDTENYAQAIACYRKASTEYPDLKLAHYQAGEAMIHLDRPAEAVGELKQELQLTPDNPEVQYALAYALLQNSDKAGAVALLQQIVAAHPEQADAQYQLGKVLVEQGDAAGAIAHLEAAEKSDGSEAYVHYQLQAAYRKVGRTGDAEREAAIYKAMKADKRAIAPAR